MRQLGATSVIEIAPSCQSLCEKSSNRTAVACGAGYSADSLLPGYSVLQTRSRPEGGCRLIARPTFETGVFTQTRQLGAWLITDLAPRLFYSALASSSANALCGPPAARLAPAALRLPRLGGRWSTGGAAVATAELWLATAAVAAG
jgi:hypothetical protein